MSINFDDSLIINVLKINVILRSSSSLNCFITEVNILKLSKSIKDTVLLKIIIKTLLMRLLLMKIIKKICERQKLLFWNLTYYNFITTFALSLKKHLFNFFLLVKHLIYLNIIIMIEYVEKMSHLLAWSLSYYNI